MRVAGRAASTPYERVPTLMGAWDPGPIADVPAMGMTGRRRSPHGIYDA